MSMYNLVFGSNPNAGFLMLVLGMDNYGEVGRFRDAWAELVDGEPVITVYTRNGGGNREHYSDTHDEGPDCTCTGCTITYKIPKHPLYLSDTDDDFDHTYCAIRYRFPKEEELSAWVREAMATTADGTAPLLYEDLLIAVTNMASETPPDRSEEAWRRRAEEIASEMKRGEATISFQCMNGHSVLVPTEPCPECGSPFFHPVSP